MFVDNSWLCTAVINVATQAVRLSYSLFDTMLDVYHVHKNVSQMFFCCNCKNCSQISIRFGHVAAAINAE